MGAFRLTRHWNSYLVSPNNPGWDRTSSLTMASTYKSLLWLVNVLVVMLVALPVLIFKLVGVPYKRGFFCDDETISHPYLASTIGNSILYGVGFGVPLLVIVVVETFIRGISGPKSDVIFGKEIPNHVVSIIRLIIGYLFGTACSQTLTDICKYSIGRLRPHFFDICRPDWNLIDCGTDIRPKFVTNYTCLGNPELFPDAVESEDRVLDSHLSFCSGHASFSFQAMIFVILYLQARLLRRDRPNQTILVHALQFAAFMYAFFTALSRISDYKHHPGDVLFGSILGTSAQMVNVIFFMKLFTKEPLEPITDDEQKKLTKVHGASYNTNSSF
ncbi:hypothetical protein TCAL_10992 [Tigriopus californicus]|uniref:Phosphatidic acid phosphatase type 2/haloperoxidase domain-containing protein n=1 Tax=Tigriopus californicus TaxID=6832 RepID=A0A553NBE5_TIGCA|nr:putative phosphatidate phosphatase isoform X2 [Tigriopus californicus]TRY62761.1 hypothetical protein TCAL_10992 [Tigriopus californicus]